MIYIHFNDSKYADDDLTVDAPSDEHVRVLGMEFNGRYFNGRFQNVSQSDNMVVREIHDQHVGVPGLADALLPMAPYAPSLHVTITYVWILISLITPSGILHGLACTYLLKHFRRSKK